MSKPLSASLPPGLIAELRLLDSITDVTDDDKGKLVLSGSHGGMYPAAIASQAQVRSVVFNDAGIGLNGAGINGVKALAEVGMAAASVDCHSARIGSTEDMLASGIISFVNTIAIQAGVAVGMKVVDALLALNETTLPTGQLAPVPEARWEPAEFKAELSLLCVDSASLVVPEDSDRVIITGSHGGLIVGDPARALKTKARLAVFNDAGVGKDRTGVSRLAALDAIGVAALTVSNESAVIGSAQSSLYSGVISHANALALELGCIAGDQLAQTLAALHLREK